MEAIEQLAIIAKKTGVPADQLINFRRAKYTPLRWQLEFHATARLADQDNGPVEIAAGGARGPGKSHCCFAQAALDDCQRYPGLKVLFLRKTAVSAKESFQDLIDRVLRGRIAFTPMQSVLLFPNESRIILGGFHDANDIDKFIGIEYDEIILEEANQLTEDKLEKLKGSLRTSKVGWRPRMYLSFNPGGIGHGFVKKRYIIPHREKKETLTRYIPSTYKNNPFLNKEYIQYLEGLGGNLGRAWREGDFDIFEGQYFSEWNYDVHTIEPFTIPQDWKRYRGLDHGSSNPTAVLWFAISPSGTIYCYREHYKIDRLASNHAKAVKLASGDEIITATFAGKDTWTPTATDGKSPTEFYEAEGVPLTKANNDRINGWRVVREYLRGNKSNRPLLQVFRTCIKLIAMIPAMIHDDRNPEDMKSDWPMAKDLDDTRDDLLDALRHFLISRSYPAHSRVDEPPVGSFLWHISQEGKKREYANSII